MCQSPRCALEVVQARGVIILTSLPSLMGIVTLAPTSADLICAWKIVSRRILPCAIDTYRHVIEALGAVTALALV